MLKIIITGSNGDNLTFEVDGKPNNGRSSASRKEVVEWEIASGTDVKAISSIVLKPIIGSEDIFSEDPPKPQNSQNTAWKGKVNRRVDIGAVFIYNIVWIKSDGTTHTCDPIISIRPTLILNQQLITDIFPGLTFAVGAFIGFIYWRMDRMRLKKENETLKKNLP